MFSRHLKIYYSLMSVPSQPQFIVLISSLFLQLNTTDGDNDGDAGVVKTAKESSVADGGDETTQGYY